MAAESINEIVSKEAIQQLIDLGTELKNVNGIINESIETVYKLGKALNDATGFRETINGINDLNKETNKLHSNNVSRLEIERQIKKSGDEMVATIRSEKEQLQLLNKVLQENTNNRYEAADLVNRLRKEQSDLKNELKNLNSAYRDGKISQEEYNGRLMDSTVAIEENKVALSNATRELKQGVKEDAAVIDSMERKSLELGRLRDLYRSLTEEERDNAEIGGVLKNAINTLDDELKGLDKSIGNNQRNVGNYEVAMGGLSSEIGKYGNIFSRVLSNTTRGALTAAGANTALGRTILAVGNSMRAVPVVGWILAAVAALISLTTLLYKHLSLERELTAEQKNRKQLEEDFSKIQKETIKRTQETLTKVKLYVSEIDKVKKGSNEWKIIAKEISKETGINYDKLVKYPDKIKEITKEWEKQFIARAKMEASLKVASENYQKTQENLSKLENPEGENFSKRRKERKEILKSLGYEGDNLEKILSLYDEVDRQKREYYENYKDGLSTTERFKNFEDELYNNTDNTNKKLYERVDIMGLLSEQQTEENKPKDDKKENERLKYFIEIQKKIEELQADSEKKMLDLRIRRLNEQRDAELKMFGLKKNDNELDEKQLNEKRLIIDRYRLEVEKDEADYNKKQLDRQTQANNELLAITNRLNEERIKNSNISNEEMTAQLVDAVKKRHEEELNQLKSAKSKELETLEEGSKTYNAVSLLYDEKLKEQTQKQEDEIVKIKKEGFDKQLALLNQQAKDAENEAIIAGEGVLAYQQASVLKLDAIKAENEALKQAREDNLISEQEYTSKSLELERLAVEEKKKMADEEIRLKQEVASATSDAFLSIAGALAQNLEDEKERVVIQQKLAMAQVLLNQGIAIAQATKGASALPFPANIPAIIAAVGTVVAQMVTSISAIRQARNAYAEGTEYHRGGSALIGERGAELVRTPKGESFVVKEPSFFNRLQVGSSVVPLSDINIKDFVTAPSASYYDGNMLNIHSNKDVVNELRNGFNRLENKPVVTVDVSENITTYIRSKISKSRVMNRRVGI